MIFNIIIFMCIIIVGGRLAVRITRPPSDQEGTPSRSGVSGWFMGSMDRILGRAQKKSPQEFQAWAEGLEPLGSPPVSELKQWLAASSPQDVQKLMNQATAFGSGLNFDIAWLLDQQLENDAQLKQRLEETMAFYCLAHFKATLVADELKVFMAWQAWQKNPLSKQQYEFSQNLFTKLVDEGLTPPAPSNLFLASNKLRQKHAIAAIRQVAEQKKDAFNAALKEVVLSDTKPAPAPPPQPEPVP